MTLGDCIVGVFILVPESKANRKRQAVVKADTKKAALNSRQEWQSKQGTQYVKVIVEH